MLPRPQLKSCQDGSLRHPPQGPPSRRKPWRFQRVRRTCRCVALQSLPWIDFWRCQIGSFRQRLIIPSPNWLAHWKRVENITLVAWTLVGRVATSQQMRGEFASIEHLPQLTIRLCDVWHAVHSRRHALAPQNIAAEVCSKEFACGIVKPGGRLKVLARQPYFFEALRAILKVQETPSRKDKLP